jgi:tight adherence protein B
MVHGTIVSRCRADREYLLRAHSFVHSPLVVGNPPCPDMNTLASPLLFAVLIGAAVFLAFFALWRRLARPDAMQLRLAEFGVSAELAARSAATPIGQLLRGAGPGQRVAEMLTRADVPLTAVEFTLIVLGAAALGFGLGTWQMSPLVGLLFAALAGAIPFLYVRFRENKRQQKFVQQLPDLLSLLIGGLRAGYGLGQALDSAREQIPPPASVELDRVMRAVSLGLPLQQALRNMAERVGSDDLNMIVTAIDVQYEVGGNLAQTLQIISETIRQRIRIKREIQVFTAQQRLTGLILAAMPIFVAFVLYIINPEYILKLFQPGIMRIVLFAGIVMQILGFLVMRKIVDIEV